MLSQRSSVALWFGRLEAPCWRRAYIDKDPQMRVVFADSGTQPVKDPLVGFESILTPSGAEGSVRRMHNKWIHGFVAVLCTSAAACQTDPQPAPGTATETVTQSAK